MSAVAKRTWIQGIGTTAVLLAGIVAAAVSGGTAHAAPTASHRTTPAVSSPATPATPTAPAPTSSTPKAPVVRAPRKPTLQLRHSAHESWSRLLATSPHGWTTTRAATPLSLAGLSKEYLKPTIVKGDLRFDGYRRGVVQAARGSRLGVVEELWQFRRPTGSAAWFTAYVASNHPGPYSLYTHSFPLGQRAAGFTTTKVDVSGFHYGVGIALEGDMIVHVRVFSTSRITRSEIVQQLHRAEPPVSRGIVGSLLPSLHHLATLGGASSVSA